MWQVIGNIADVIALITVVISIFTWKNTQKLKNDLKKENKRKNDPIKVILNNGEEEVILPVEVSRKDVTRNEIMGRLGMIPMKGAEQRRFSIRYTTTKSFIDQIIAIYEGNSDQSLIIPCKKGEIEQFDLKAFLKKD